MDSLLDQFSEEDLEAKPIVQEVLETFMDDRDKKWLDELTVIRYLAVR